ncbi:hypothetical protein N7456_004063 [Penicillium angulare]|uniref:Zn(2)-C6 fungal-type domain-containing protein n=1 Tax=Penicillium angulare TaxID=116970 RepID=A0A9W9FVZ8_9EURO|nr:hypothetical protein N7456_004063 [Penicillium angulare]
MESIQQTSPEPTVTVACLNCRDRHLKYDGNPEGCARCRTSSIFCHYVPSRRGRRGQPNDYLVIDTSCLSNLDDSELLTGSPLPLVVPSDVSPPYLADAPQVTSSMGIHLINAYYEYFHPAHPILSPLDIWTASSPPRFLIKIVEFIGSHYFSPGQIPKCPNDLWTATGAAAPSLEKAQSYLLLGILLHAHKVPDGAKECIGLAIQCSLNIGLHCRDTSDAMEVQDRARAECMRRTMWEIFVIDTLLAAVQVGGTLQFNIGTPAIALPSEEMSFGDDSCKTASIIADDLVQRAFSGVDRISSLAYRVEATLILRQCVQACESYASEDSIHVLDSLVSAWFHRWPSDKSAILQMDGRVNQIDFQAAMIMHSASIYLHFSRSQLISYLPTTREVFCSRPPPTITAPTSNPQMHAAKIINAAVELSKLASLSTHVTEHSPFFACILVLSSIVQLTVISVRLGEQPKKYYSYLAVNIGALQSMGNIWNIAASSTGNLQQVAREVGRTSTELSPFFGGL